MSNYFDHLLKVGAGIGGPQPSLKSNPVVDDERMKPGQW